MHRFENNFEQFSRTKIRWSMRRCFIGSSLVLPLQYHEFTHCLCLCVVSQTTAALGPASLYTLPPQLWPADSASGYDCRAQLTNFGANFGIFAFTLTLSFCTFLDEIRRAQLAKPLALSVSVHLSKSTNFAYHQQALANLFLEFYSLKCIH